MSSFLCAHSSKHSWRDWEPRNRAAFPTGLRNGLPANRPSSISHDRLGQPMHDFAVISDGRRAIRLTEKGWKRLLPNGMRRLRTTPLPDLQKWQSEVEPDSIDLMRDSDGCKNCGQQRRRAVAGARH